MLRIAVIGDFMLDGYLLGEEQDTSEGKITRVSNTRFALGGAGHLCVRLKQLGCDVVSFGVVGYDPPGEMIRKWQNRKWQNRKRQHDYLIPLENYETPVKTRVVNQNRVVCRYDRERTFDIPAKVENILLDALRFSLKYIDGIAIQDYNKGVLTPRVIEEVLKLDKLVFVDPKFDNAERYVGAYLLKPNLHELIALQAKVAPTLMREIDLEDARASLIFGRRLQNMREHMHSTFLVVTLGSEGMIGVGSTLRVVKASRVVNFVDSIGAGDAAFAGLIVGLLKDKDLSRAMDLATSETQKVCETLGTLGT